MLSCSQREWQSSELNSFEWILEEAKATKLQPYKLPFEQHQHEKTRFEPHPKRCAFAGLMTKLIQVFSSDSTRLVFCYYYSADAADADASGEARKVNYLSDAWISNKSEMLFAVPNRWVSERQKQQSLSCVNKKREDCKKSALVETFKMLLSLSWAENIWRPIKEWRVELSELNSSWSSIEIRPAHSWQLRVTSHNNGRQMQSEHHRWRFGFEPRWSRKKQEEHNDNHNDCLHRN